MIWLTSLSLLLVLFSQHHGVESRRQGPTPWTDPIKAGTFMNCLVEKIASSPVFPTQEKQDLESIVETMMSAISSVSGGSNSAQIQALNVAFASSLAEIVIADEAGNQQSIEMKTNIIGQIVRQCSISSIGTVDRKFMTEMKDLIIVLAQEANAEANEIDAEDQYPYPQPGGTTQGFGTSSNAFAGAFGSSTFGSGTASTTTSSTSSSTTISQSLSTALASSLSSSAVFQSVFGAGLSSQTLAQIAVSATQKALINIGVSSNQANTLGYSIQNSLLNLGYGASPNDYANALSTSIATALQQTGVLNQNNVQNITNALTSAYIQSFTSLATQYSIQVSQSAATSIGTSTSTTSTTSTSAANAFGASNAFGSTGAISSQSSTNAAVQSMASALSSSGVIQSILGAGLSSQALSQLTVSATVQALSQAGVSYSAANSVTSSLQSSILNLGSSASVSSYSNAIASSVVNGLSSSGVLTSANASSLISSLSSVYLQSLTSVASQYNIQVSQSATSSSTALMSTTSGTSSSTSQSVSSGLFGDGSAISGSSAGTAGSLLSSSQGLTSPGASSRIQALSQGLLGAFGPNGFQPSALSQGLGSTYFDLVNSGLSPDLAQTEALLETVVALVQLLYSAQVGSVNVAATSAITQSVAASITSAFGNL